MKIRLNRSRYDSNPVDSENAIKEQDFSDYFESTRDSRATRSSAVEQRHLNEISRHFLSSSCWHSRSIDSPSERRSLARHCRNFNSIKSLQVLRDSDHGEYLFLPTVCGPVARFGLRQPESYSPGLFSFDLLSPVARRRRGDETIIGEVGNYRMTPLAFAVVCDVAPDANLKCRLCMDAREMVAKDVYTRGVPRATGFHLNNSFDKFGTSAIWDFTLKL